MKYLDFKKALAPFLVFSLGEIRKLEGGFDLRRLNEWCAKGYLIKLRRGHYAFADQEWNEQKLFGASNALYAPSYVSCESALSYYGLIPEMTYATTAVTSSKTAQFDTPLGRFWYRSLKASLLFGYSLLTVDSRVAKLAYPEKALLDYFYLNPKISHQEDFASLRIDRQSVHEQINVERLQSYCAAFNNHALEKRVAAFRESVDHA